MGSYKVGRRTITDDVKPEEFKDGRLLKSKSIAIADLEDGDYRLIVNLREAGSAQVIASANLPLRIGPSQPEPPLYFSADSQGLARPGVAAYMRALEAISRRTMPPRSSISGRLWLRVRAIRSPASIWSSSTSTRNSSRRSPSCTRSGHRGLQVVARDAGANRAQLPPDRRRCPSARRRQRWIGLFPRQCGPDHGLIDDPKAPDALVGVITFSRPDLETLHSDSDFEFAEYVAALLLHGHIS